MARATLRRFPATLTVKTLGSFPFPLQYASITDSITSGWSRPASEVKRSIGKPSATALQATALSSAFRVRIVESAQGRIRLPENPRWTFWIPLR